MSSGDSISPQVFESDFDWHPPAPIEVPGYEIVRKLASGGQGAIYLAIQKSARRTVAMKVVGAGSHVTPAERSRFRREVETVAQLRHANIVRLYDCGRSADGIDYYTMDYIKGWTLDKFVRGRQLPLHELLSIMSTVCDAMAYAHKAGVIHRDLTPRNIVVDGSGTPFIVDFGLAKCLMSPRDHARSVTAGAIGTVPYMSPEQVQGSSSDIDWRSDIYSLGVVLYTLVTGQFPYPITDDLAFSFQQITQTPPVPPAKAWDASTGITRLTRRDASVRCPVSASLQAVLLKTLRKEREQRYTDMNALSTDLRRCMQGLAVEASRGAIGYELRTLTRRHGAKVFLGAIILTLTVLAIALRAQLQSTRRIADITAARIEMLLGNTESAARMFSGIRKDDPTNVEAGLLEMEAALRQGDAGRAVAIGHALHAENPGEWRLACALAELGEPPEGAEDMGKACALLAPNDIAVRMGRARFARSDARALDLYDEVLVQQPRHFDALRNRSLHLFKVGRLDEALADARVALDTRPNSAIANYNVGSLLLQALKFGEAAGVLEKAVKADPKLASAWYNLGLAYKSKSDRDAAAAFRRCVQINPTHAEAWYELGRSWNYLGRHDDARAALRRADALSPNTYRILRYRSINEQNGGNFAESLRLLKRSREFKQGHEIDVAYAQLLAQNGQEREALDIVDRIFDALTSPGVINRAAWVAVTSTSFPPDRLRAIVERLEQVSDKLADKTDSTYLNIQGTLALGRMRLGDYVAARKHLDTSVGKDEDDAWSAIMRAYLLAVTGHAEEARRARHVADQLTRGAKDPLLLHFHQEMSALFSERTPAP